MRRRFHIISALVVLLCVSVQAQSAAKDRWTRIASPNFLVTGDGPEQDLRRAAMKLEQFREVLSRLFGKADLRTSAPVRVLVLSPEKYDAVRPKVDGKAVPSSGFFQPGSDVHHIALTVGDPVADPWAIVLHEYVHLLLHENARVVPLWFAEGLAEYFSTFEVLAGDKRVRIGNPIQRHLATLKSGPLLPLDELFATTPDSARYNEKEKQGVFYAESWALVHYLMLGKNQRRQPKVAHFIKDISQGMPAGDSFRGVFEISYGDMLGELRRYLQAGEYFVQLVDFDQRLQSGREIKSTLLSEAQQQFYLGDLLLHMKRITEAQDYLARAIQLDPALAEAHAALAVVQTTQGRQADARAEADRAVKSNPSSYLFLYYRALVASGAAADVPGSPSAESAGLARADLAKAIELAPGFTESYNLLAWVNLVSGTQIDESVELLNRALAISPGRQEILLTLAQLHLHKGEWTAAGDIVEPIIVSGATPELRTKARELLQRVHEAAERQAGVPIGRPAAQGASLEDRIAEQALGAGAAPPPAEADASGDVQEISGLLVEITCREKQMTLVVQAGPKRLNFATATPEHITFTSYTTEVVTEVKCGPRTTATPVLVRFRKSPGETQSDGEPVSVDFVQP